MASNGVYFGAEIVRDLTPAPGSRMVDGEEREGEGERGWGGGGQEREPSLRAPTLPALSPTPLSVHLSPCPLPPANRPFLFPVS